ncbi:MAG: hypothetical protein A2494_00600 [Candidatus Lloydbacteria bacterium RIFOXYC12_FULL_46_25]|uniref:Com family DNA-binding transcriptional regulator n=1 Tax=Candidatus Lloydbacteria bacterium RIFOXYC12_FULL_46_25 TaxID=1798670 RepID=A0A1G2DU54_9BACT|nr:MAG: hypothetical protein A2494_00600 [Candidatus Lloydbacteria bacterium RIFOXYC12_FULL_46_25]
MIYQEYRCRKCKKLMFKAILVESEIEVKCRACGELNVFQGISQEKLLCFKENCERRVKRDDKREA